MMCPIQIFLAKKKIQFRKIRVLNIKQLYYKYPKSKSINPKKTTKPVHHNKLFDVIIFRKDVKDLEWEFCYHVVNM